MGVDLKLEIAITIFQALAWGLTFVRKAQKLNPKQALA
jgi:hypothetical protein